MDAQDVGNTGSDPFRYVGQEISDEQLQTWQQMNQKVIKIFKLYLFQSKYKYRRVFCTDSIQHSAHCRLDPWNNLQSSIV